MTADVVIVGAGSAGCALAYRLGEAGLRVTVIEHGAAMPARSSRCLPPCPIR